MTSNWVTLTGLQTGPLFVGFYSDISVTFANNECNPIGVTNFCVFMLHSVKHKGLNFPGRGTWECCVDKPDTFTPMCHQ